MHPVEHYLSGLKVTRVCFILRAVVVAKRLVVHVGFLSCVTLPPTLANVGRKFRRRLTEIEAKRVTLQLLDGLDYLHSKGIVHCDIKPQNLLFADDPADPDATAEKGAGAGSNHPSGETKQVTSPAGRLAKLCDFGLSCKVKPKHCWVVLSSANVRETCEEIETKRQATFVFTHYVQLFAHQALCCFMPQVPDVRFYKQTGDINKIPWSGLFGTGGYIAPEIMRQEAFGKPADLWYMTFLGPWHCWN